MPTSSNRFSPPGHSAELGLLEDLSGSWSGKGFNLIARPDFSGDANLYLQLNQTMESYDVTPIGSPVPNRACGCDGVDLYGLTYIHRVRDALTDAALHIETGMWMRQPSVDYPVQTPPAGGDIVYRMASVPHGNAVLAQGSALPFSGPPVLEHDGRPYAFSDFLSFNSTPITGVTPPEEAIMNAAGSSEKGTSRSDKLKPFDQYDLSVPAGATNPRTPYDTHPADPELPAELLGVPMQDVVNDPITLLQAQVRRQVEQGYTFEGVAINAMTQPSVGFRESKNDPYGPHVSVKPPHAAGGLSNTPFLAGGVPTGSRGPNAEASLVYATMWVEKLTHPTYPPMLQIQYAQMCVINFQILLMPDQGIIGWPHISVATLHKSFG